MPSPTLSLADTRTLHLAAQGLLRLPTGSPQPHQLLDAIRAMGLLQIDTISVVARSPYLVLFSRLGAYPPTWLDEALAQRQLFEYWAHEACFIPIEDFRLLRHRMLDPAKMGWKYNAAWHQAHQPAIEKLLAHIEQHGPVRSADFSRPAGSGNGWWDWKPEKRHLETLFTLGQVMVAERRNFHRVYDVTARVKPDWSDTRDALDEATARQEMLRRSARSLGIFKAAWLPDYYRLKRVALKPAIVAMLEEGSLHPVSVEGSDEPWYLHHSLLPLCQQMQQRRIRSSVTTLLSPFDPVVWHRKRALELFDFDYRIECYTPQEKRRYGYFVLPILQRGALIGRTDAKMHRKEGVFEIKGLWLEPGVRLGAQRLRDLTEAVTRCARWHGATRIAVDAVPEALRPHWGQGWACGQEIGGQA